MAKNQISQIGGKYGPGIENDPNLRKTKPTTKFEGKQETASGKPANQSSNGLFEALPAKTGTKSRSIGAVSPQPSNGLAERNGYLR